jgi:hypothetical protein
LSFYILSLLEAVVTGKSGEEINPIPETERLRFVDRHGKSSNRKNLRPKDG